MGPWATASYCRAGIKSLRGTETDINRSIFKNCLVGKCPFQAPNGHHHEKSINVFSVLSSTFFTIPTRKAVSFRMILFCCSWSLSPCFCYSARFKRFLHRLALASHWLGDLKNCKPTSGKKYCNKRYCRFLKHQQQANISPFFIGEFYSTFEQLCWLKNKTQFYCLKTTSQPFFTFTEKRSSISVLRQNVA